MRLLYERQTGRRRDQTGRTRLIVLAAVSLCRPGPCEEVAVLDAVGRIRVDHQVRRHDDAREVHARFPPADQEQGSQRVEYR